MAEVWPHIPMPEISENLSWVTAVHPRRDDDSRWSLRPARQSFTMQNSLTGEDYQTARFLFASNVLGEWLVPVWTEATRGVQVDASDDTITVDMDAEYAPGGKAIVWATCDDWTVVEVAARHANSITLTDNVGTHYSSALVMPLRTCICRKGLQLQQTGADFYMTSAAFEAKDNPDLSLILEKMQILFALDTWPTMETVAFDDVTRLDLEIDNAIAAVRWLQASSLVHDVRVIVMTDPDQVIERRNCDADDYDDICDFIAGITSGMSNSFDHAFDDAAAFFDGTQRREMFIYSNHNGSNLADAIASRDAIDDLTCNVFLMSDVADISSLDSSGVAETIDVLNLMMFDATRLRLLGLPTYRSTAYLKNGHRVIEARAGMITRAAVYVDSGLGPVAIEPVRQIVEDSISTLMRPDDAACRFELKRLLHFIAGQDRPFLIQDFELPITGFATYIEVPKVRAVATDWIGDIVLIDGVANEVIDAAPAGGRHRLYLVDNVSIFSKVLTRLRRVRLTTDEVQLDHRRDRWASARLAMVAA